MTRDQWCPLGWGYWTHDPDGSLSLAQLDRPLPWAIPPRTTSINTYMHGLMRRPALCGLGLTAVLRQYLNRLPFNYQPSSTFFVFSYRMRTGKSKLNRHCIECQKINIHLVLFLILVSLSLPGYFPFKKISQHKLTSRSVSTL